ncbi:hypothetical protein KBC79_05080 [Candidatus Woesebacteria bacterium]|nr:hypothetical protein [Candidatus Woesebacteria bacterium]
MEGGGGYREYNEAASQWQHERQQAEAAERAERFEEILQLLADLIEKGPAMDPAIQQQKRKQLQALMKQAGVLNAQGQLDLDAWMSLCTAISESKTTAVTPPGYPTLEEFSSIISQNQEYFWDDHYMLTARGFPSLEEYLHGLGTVLATQLVYETVFADDPIVIRNGVVENGRHRALTLRVLSRLGQPTQSWHWIKKTQDD